MQFYPFRAQHLDLFDWQGPQRQYLHLKTGDYVARLVRDGVGWTGVDDAGVVGCAGLVAAPYGLAAWAAFSERVALHKITVVRFVRRVIRDRPEPHIRTLISRDHAEAARFAEVVGFRVARSPASDDPSEAGFDLYQIVRGS